MGRHVARDDEMLTAAAPVQPELAVGAARVGPVIDVSVPGSLVGRCRFGPFSCCIALIDEFYDVTWSAIGAFDDHGLIISRRIGSLAIRYIRRSVSWRASEQIVLELVKTGADRRRAVMFFQKLSIPMNHDNPSTMLLSEHWRDHQESGDQYHWADLYRHRK